MKTYQTPQIGVMQIDFTIVLTTSGEPELANSLDNLGKDITWKW